MSAGEGTSKTIKCEDCGHRNPRSNATCSACGTTLSVGTDSIDHLAEQQTEDDLIAQASVPNLAALFGKAKAAGHIRPVQDYGNPA